MEGDTPSYLGLIDNGLASWWNPGWGGWGGRYIFRQPYGETHAIWTQGGDLFGRVSSQDTVTGADGKSHTSDQATIWRWREAFQHDFAARMDWTIKPFSEANHNPVVVVNGQAGTAPIFVDAVVGQPVGLDASQSRDPDGQTLHYSWFHYAEAGFGDGRGLAAVNIADAESSKVTITATADLPSHVDSNGRRKMSCPGRCPHYSGGDRQRLTEPYVVPSRRAECQGGAVRGRKILCGPIPWYPTHRNEYARAGHLRFYRGRLALTYGLVGIVDQFQSDSAVGFGVEINGSAFAVRCFPGGRL